MKSVHIIIAAVVVALIAAASASAAGVRFAQGAASYETKQLLKNPSTVTAHCSMSSPTKMGCRLELASVGVVIHAKATLAPLTLHSYRVRLCTSPPGKCETFTKKTSDHSHMIVKS